AAIPDLASQFRKTGATITRQMLAVSSGLADIGSPFVPALSATKALSIQVVETGEVVERQIRTASAGLADVASQASAAVAATPKVVPLLKQAAIERPVISPPVDISSQASASQAQLLATVPPVEQAGIELSGQLAKANESVARQIRGVSSDVADIVSPSVFTAASKAAVELSNQVITANDSLV